MPIRQPVANVPDVRLDVVIVGDPAVGKSALARRYVEQTFPGPEEVPGGAYESETVHEVNLITDNFKIIRLRINASATDHHGRRSSTLGKCLGADGIVVAYDLTDRDTFRSARQWLRSVAQLRADHPHMHHVRTVLLATKHDLAHPYRQVPREDAEALARAEGVAFEETSARTNYRVTFAFHRLCCELISREPGARPSHSHRLRDRSESPEFTRRLMWVE